MPGPNPSFPYVPIRRRACAGMAIVAVMWLVAALAVLVMGLVATTRADLRGAQNLRLFAEHAAWGDAAITLAATTMLTTPLAERPFVSRFEVEGRTLNVEVVPAAAFVDLNHASVDLLRDTLLYGAGLSEADAQTFAERIVDWRDTDDAALPNGAEDPAYEAAGSPFRTRGGPFESLDDLMQVLGMTLELHDRLSRLLTIHGASVGVDPRYASAAVLAVLAAGNNGEVDRILAARGANDPLTDMTGLTQEYLARTSGRLYRFEAWREVGDLRLARVRWLDLGRPDPAGVPWREISAEPVTSELVSTEHPDGA